MTRNFSASNKAGVNLPGVLLIVFIVLKLTGVIDWKWLWVFSPAWIYISILAIIFLVVFIVGLIRNK